MWHDECSRNNLRIFRVRATYIWISPCLALAGFVAAGGSCCCCFFVLTILSDTTYQSLWNLSTGKFEAKTSRRFDITIFADGDAGESVTKLDAIVDMKSHAEATSKAERADGGNKRKWKSQALKVWIERRTLLYLCFLLSFYYDHYFRWFIGAEGWST